MKTATVDWITYRLPRSFHRGKQKDILRRLGWIPSFFMRTRTLANLGWSRAHPSHHSHSLIVLALCFSYLLYVGAFSTITGVLLAILLIQLITQLRRYRRLLAQVNREKATLEVEVAHRLEEIKQLEREKLSELYRFASIGKAASTILHDLVTPLSALSLTLARIEERQPHELLARAKMAAMHMEGYITSARETIKAQKNKQVFSVQAEICHCIATIQHIANDNRVSLEYETQSDFLLYGTVARFTQIIFNCLKNGLESFHAKSNRPRIVRIHTRVAQNQLVITIADTGQGIPTTKLPHIFEPFYSTKPGKGMGLGLSLAHEVMQTEFMGSIQVSSQVNSGTVITLYFPDLR
jgi:signal transduction histidine kinase